MFALKPSVVAAVAAGLSVALMAGCKTTKPAPPAATPVAAKTNQWVPPAQVSGPADSTDSMGPNILTWDSLSKEYQAKPGELKAPFSFSLTNVSSQTVTILDTSTTCDCTVASLPSTPWKIPSGGTGTINATIDLSNKVGTVTNSIVVFTSQGNRRLNVKAILPGSK
jgi:hypothetical protein